MTTVSSTRLTDHPQEFFRLLGLPLPIVEYHEHYLKMWMEHDPSMSSKVSGYNEYLSWCSEKGYKSPQFYKMEVAVPAFRSWMANWGPDTWAGLNEPFGNLHQFKKLDRRNQFKGELLLSIDVVKGNYAAMSLMASQLKIHIPERWEDLCESLEIHPFLTKSKSFRQYCFGLCDPERFSTVQKQIIALLIEHLGIKPDDLVFVSNDEIIIKCPELAGFVDILQRLSDGTAPLSSVNFRLTPFRNTPVYNTVIKKSRNMEMEAKISELREKKMKVVHAQKYEEAAVIRNEERALMAEMEKFYSQQVGEQEKVEADSDYSIRTEYRIGHDGLHETKKSLVGVPNNRFYLYFRNSLMIMPFEEKDLLFKSDGMMAKWVLPEKIE